MNIIAPEIVPTMGKCGSCGALPSDHVVSAWPRVDHVDAMGRPWKVHVICWICGNVHVGKDEAAAVAKWNEGFMGPYFMELPSDAADIERVHQRALNETA